jgi:hypothetical protein
VRKVQRIKTAEGGGPARASGRGQARRYPAPNGQNVIEENTKIGQKGYHFRDKEIERRAEPNA